MSNFYNYFYFVFNIFFRNRDAGIDDWVTIEIGGSLLVAGPIDCDTPKIYFLNYTAIVTDGDFNTTLDVLFR